MPRSGHLTLRKYSDEFRLTAVRLSRQSGIQVKTVAAAAGKRQKAVMCVTFSASTRSLRTQLLVSCRSVYTR